ncbi:ABC transporter substrate-binding protein [Bradyrhizobium japonicum]|nr:ABC transporter substrate-binding protein [Bradyrhizobium japonicum]
MKRWFLLGFAAASTILSVSGAVAEPLQKVRTYSQTNYPGFVNYAAKELGFLEKYGIDPDMKFLPSGGPIVQAAASKEWDIAFLGAPPAVIGASALGVITIGMNYEEAAEHELIGRPDYVAAVQADPQKLKGAKIFVTTLSTGHYMFEGCMRKLGVNISDVNIIPSEQTATVSAFAAGQGDIAQVWPPQSTTLKERGNKPLCNGKEAGLSVATVWVVTQEFAKNHPDLVVKWLKANNDAIHWMKQDFERTYALYQKWDAYRGFNLPTAVLREEVVSVSKIIPAEDQVKLLLPPAPGEKAYLVKSYEGIADFFIRMGRLKEKPDFRPYVDGSFLQQVVKDGT